MHMDDAKAGDLILVRFSESYLSRTTKTLCLTLKGLNKKLNAQALDNEHFNEHFNDLSLNQNLIFLTTKIEFFNKESKTVWEKWDVFFSGAESICIARHDRRIIERRFVRKNKR